MHVFAVSAELAARWEVFGHIGRSDWNVCSNSCKGGHTLWWRSSTCKTQKSACSSARDRCWLNLLKDRVTKGLTSECCVVFSWLPCLISAVKVRAAVKYVFVILFFQAPSSDFTRTDSPIREAPYSPTIQLVSSLNTEHSSLLIVPSFYLIFLLFHESLLDLYKGIYSSTFWPFLPLLAQPPLFQQLPVCRQGDPLCKWVMWPSLCWPGCFFSKCISSSFYLQIKHNKLVIVLYHSEKHVTASPWPVDYWCFASHGLDVLLIGEVNIWLIVLQLSTDQLCLDILSQDGNKIKCFLEQSYLIPV